MEVPDTDGTGCTAVSVADRTRSTVPDIDGTRGMADWTGGTADGTVGTADETRGTADGTRGTADGTRGTADGTGGTDIGTGGTEVPDDSAKQNTCHESSANST